MARKNGCPFSVRDWQIDIRSRASTNESPTWIPIKGMESLDFSMDAETEDGSSAQSLYSEPYITKRSGSMSMELKRIVDRVTGAKDLGQEELDYYATLGGCDADARFRMADAVGNTTILDAVVTGVGNSADDTSESVSYDTEIVGEPEILPYVPVASVTTTPATSLAAVVEDIDEVTVNVLPVGASNKKYSVYSSDAGVVKVMQVDGNEFEIKSLKAGTATLTIKTMNGAKTATITVTVT